MNRLAPFSTLGLGGPALRLVVAEDENSLIAAVSGAEGEVLLLGGGSNVVISDDGFAGSAVVVRTRGIDPVDGVLWCAAGEPWDAVVVAAVDLGLAGIECLSGIPGSTGATPIQNVGAYGQDVSQTVSAVRVFDRTTGEVSRLAGEDCGFAYRSSRFKREPDRFVILAVGFSLERSALSQPVAYRELADRLGVPVGGRAPLGAVRSAVLDLRAGKGMVLDPGDPDTRSVGSFFTNPIVDASAVTGWPQTPPSWPEPDGRIKLSAAWLVQNAGFPRGFGNSRARISTKHTLALTAREGGTTRDLLDLAATVRDGVRDRFGIELVPEPVLVGVTMP